MKDTITALLNGKGGNNLLPFFWQHGEDEETLRHYMKKIHESGCGAVCVESRPHPDFCGDKWWADLDAIIDEAKKLDMEVWILDDDHFPTGHANGAVDTAPAELCRQSVYYTSRLLEGDAGHVEIPSAELFALPPAVKSPMQEMIESFNPPVHRHFDDDAALGIVALPLGGSYEDYVNLSANVENGLLKWEKPEGSWQLYASGLSRNCGPHRGHINMMDMDSCRLLIDAVYEPHYARYKEEFGKTIAGFFSDEPELGNGALYGQGNTLGTPQDLPWSRLLQEELSAELGPDWTAFLPLLWENGYDKSLTARVRTAYMDKVSSLVERCFSMQLGDWCGERGVKYIGHVVEDNNQHARTGSSLGHFFRGLNGQHMAGIDDIGGQVMPGCEDEPKSNMGFMPRDGEFYHYLLAKLGVSHGAIDPRKQGRAMCEIFGAYGWGEGVRLEKYLVDHFLVRGINHYVPHAFSPLAYPDPDCPPHFYAHGHNPQFRHFGALMRYTNRICQIISGGRREVTAALLYHGESEWAGGEYMYCQKPARVMLDNQIDFDIIPDDVFTRGEYYSTNINGGFKVNNQNYKVFIIPGADFIPAGAAEAAIKLHGDGFPVVFIDRLPLGICGGENYLLEDLQGCPVVALENLAAYFAKAGIYDLKITPANNRVRSLHYIKNEDAYIFVNEGSSIYEGRATVPSKGNCYIYDAWNNRTEKADFKSLENGTEINICLLPLHSLIIVFGDNERDIYRRPELKGESIVLENWKRALCKSIEYPAFNEYGSVSLPDKLAEEKPEFSGYARYETSFNLEDRISCLIEVEDAAEGVELFMNGISAGIQIAPPFVYDVGSLVKKGENHLAIEVATTLEREQHAWPKSGNERMMPVGEPQSLSGITGKVKLLT